jgi:hypothetical protein
MFLMILGSLESHQRAPQIYAEKHHSRTKKDKPNDERFNLSIKDKPVKPPIMKNAISMFHAKSVFDELELIMKITTSFKTSLG